MVATKSKPIPCDALLYYVISVDQHKCYYLTTHPSYHDDQVGLRFSFDVLKMYL